MVPQALLTKSGLVYVNSYKRVHTARPKTEVNTVKASASWVWKPKQEVIDHVSKSNNASKTLTRYDYVDAYGRFKTSFISPGKIIVPAVSWSCSMVTAVLVASVCAGRRETAPHCDSRCLFFHKVYYHFEGRQIWNGEFLAPFEGRLSVQFDLKEIMAVLFVNQQKYFEVMKCFS
ncbi:hypothetical protein Tco_0094058 [Tanacetum coccineum]